MQDYKFTVTMDNAYEYGYTTEKVISGLFAKTVPIYFGGPNISQIINPDRIVHCQIPEEALFAARAEWHGTPPSE